MTMSSLHLDSPRSMKMDETLPRAADESRVNFWQRAVDAVLMQRKRHGLIVQENNAKSTTSILTGSNDAHPVSRLARKVMLTLPDDSKMFDPLEF